MYFLLKYMVDEAYETRENNIISINKNNILPFSKVHPFISRRRRSAIFLLIVKNLIIINYINNFIITLICRFIINNNNLK
ncbi:hypothetical protein AYO04_28455 [Raoultella planticola]|nr:hypothetical protein AYO04_28455 [Raoultella planticola]